jgi:hypothetical protein
MQDSTNLARWEIAGIRRNISSPTEIKGSKSGLSSNWKAETLEKIAEVSLQAFKYWPAGIFCGK